MAIKIEKKTIIFLSIYFNFFIYFFFFEFTLYRYCSSRMIKVTDLEYFIFIAFTLKFDVKSLLSEAVTLAGGIREPLLTCSTF